MAEGEREKKEKGKERGTRLKHRSALLFLWRLGKEAGGTRRR